MTYLVLDKGKFSLVECRLDEQPIGTWYINIDTLYWGYTQGLCAIDIMRKLDSTLSTHLDMGGKHKYSLNNKSHEVITEMKTYLYLLDKIKENKNDS